ncbi:uncharacterized protein LOC122327550 [Puntigrus tetrazona]|uniref:uncharacterized protein LOC122327550 n=1 Tax=Puntigrus tetrazona TaxID=1606681 RepID=UPI001C8959CA|nr:uncharacterized protein LOC122327550 [Puntigrus tetrazona]
MKGDIVTLVTGVQTDQQEKIHWYFNDNRIAYINGNLSDICTDVRCDNRNERFRGRLKLDHQTGSLTIMNARNTDSGNYKLEIIKEGVSAAERDGKCVKEGENVHFDSGVTNEPVVSMMWLFNCTPIFKITKDQCKISTDGECGERFNNRLEVTGSLTVTDTRTTDSGIYQLQFNSSRFSIIRCFRVTVTDSCLPSGKRGMVSGDSTD